MKPSPIARTRNRIVAVLVLVLAAGLGLVATCRGSGAASSTLQTAVAAKRTLRSQIQATGAVRAMIGAEVKVGARISGRVEKLLVNIGDPVEKGATIARLDDRDLSARLARAEADRAAAEAQLALIRRGSRAEDRAEAEASVRQAEAEHRLAAADHARLSSLAAQKLASEADADRALRDRDVTAAKLATARSRLATVRRRFLPEDVALAEARLRQAEATVDEARATRSYATIEAPIAGVVASVTTQEGETVSAGLNAPTFLTIIDLDRLEVAAYVDEVDVGRVRIGQAATFTVDSYPDVEFSGRVTAIYPRAVIQSNVVNYITTVSIDNAEGRLKPDMTATVDIALDERPDALAVPDRALRRENGRRIVQVVEDGKPRSREVRPGMRGGGFTEILSGLREGEVVVAGEAVEKPAGGTK